MSVGSVGGGAGADFSPIQDTATPGGVQQIQQAIQSASNEELAEIHCALMETMQQGDPNAPVCEIVTVNLPSGPVQVASDELQGLYEAADAEAVCRPTFAQPPAAPPAPATGPVPAHTQGVASNASARRSFGTEAEARDAFERQKNTLLDVGNWTRLSGFENASFDLCDANGRQVNRPPQVGDFVRIDIPGPSGHDWVRIEDIRNGPDAASITVRPSYDPTDRPVRRNVTSHFFTSAATNTFMVERSGTTVTSAVRGRNEVANTGSEASSWASRLRSRAVAAGAWGVDLPFNRTTGVQQHQWNVFTENLSKR